MNKHGFTLAGLLLVLLGASGFGLTALTPRVSAPSATRALLATDLDGLLPQGGTCLRCTACDFTYWDGTTAPGHETTPSGATTGSGIGGPEHGCALQSTDMCVYNQGYHVMINCTGGGQLASIPPRDLDRMLELANGVAAGSEQAFDTLTRDFAARIQVDRAAGLIYFNGCRPGVFSGVLPIPTQVS